jgi:predicted dehydrogenase
MIGEIDAGIVATPTPTHHSIACTLLERGIHTLVEKPITSSVGEAENLIRTAERSDIVLQVGHIERFNPAFKYIEPIIDSPYYIEARRFSQFRNKNLDTSVVFDLMIHDIDIVCRFVEDVVVRIDAEGNSLRSNTIDEASVMLYFGNGCRVKLLSSRVSDRKIREMTIMQEDLRVDIDFLNVEISMKDGGEASTITVVSEKETLKAELESFIEEIKNNNYTPVSPYDSLVALSLAQQVMDKILDNAK